MMIKLFLGIILFPIVSSLLYRLHPLPISHQKQNIYCQSNTDNHMSFKEKLLLTNNAFLIHGATIAGWKFLKLPVHTQIIAPDGSHVAWFDYILYGTNEIHKDHILLPLNMSSATFTLERYQQFRQQLHAFRSLVHQTALDPNIAGACDEYKRLARCVETCRNGSIVPDLVIHGGIGCLHMPAEVMDAADKDLLWYVCRNGPGSSVTKVKVILANNNRIFPPCTPA